MKKIFFIFALLSLNINCIERKTGTVKKEQQAEAAARVEENSAMRPSAHRVHDEGMENLGEPHINVEVKWWECASGVCCCLCVLKYCIESCLN